jgi:hypothetical protein
LNEDKQKPALNPNSQKLEIYKSKHKIQAELPHTQNFASASAQVEKHRSKCLMALPAVARLKFILTNCLVCMIIE